MITARTSRRADRHEAGAYLSAAEEFQAAAEDCADEGWWRAAGTMAVHAAIAAGDAACVFHLGERSTGVSHEDASDLLLRSGADGARGRAEQLRAVLDLKNKVEYESRPVTEGEARALIKRSRRLLEWALRLVPRS